MARPLKTNADYFSHDTWMRNDMKVKALRRKYWMEWYAIYVMMLEIITSCDNFELLLPDNDIVVWEVIAWDIDTDSERLKEILAYMIVLWLFVREWSKIYSIWLKKRLQQVIEKRDKMQSNAMKRWSKNENNNAIALKNDAIASFQAEETIQSKVKESKEKKIHTDDSSESSNESLFEKFWESYPKKTDKKVSERRFLSLSIKKQNQAIEAIKKWKEYWNLDETEIKFIPMPSTWISKERWNEDPPKLENKSGSWVKKVRVADWFDTAEDDAKKHEKEVELLWKKFHALSKKDQEILSNQAISECERFKWKVWYESMVNGKVLILFRKKYNL